MKKLIMVKYGEIALKKQNRSYFINALTKNIKNALRDFDQVICNQIQGRIVVENIEESDEIAVLDRLKKVFGIVSLTRAFEVDPNMETIKETALQIMKEKHHVTFKTEARRSDKSFPFTSPEIAKSVGAFVLIHTDDITVDVHHPDITLNIEIRKKAYIYYENIPCEAGMPIGVSGRGCLLLSGGIDSPVAGFMIARRGMKIEACHFHSYPYTSLEAKEKVIEIAQKLKEYNQGIQLHSISLTKIQEEILLKCDESYLTVILRRFMFRCAEKLSEARGLQALITGESLGQVASQTIESITCTNDSVALPVLRPLIGMDKNEIVRHALHIDTYEISIQPFEDCCTIFLPKHPQIKPTLEKVIAQESKLDIEKLIEDAMTTLETIRL